MTHPHHTPALHTSSGVICQFTTHEDDDENNPPVHHRLTGFVRGPAPGGDPDKVIVDIICPITSPANLLVSPITFARVLQHGDEGEHATFRYPGE